MPVDIGADPHVTWGVTFACDFLDIFKARVIADAKSGEQVRCLFEGFLVVFCTIPWSEKNKKWRRTDKSFELKDCLDIVFLVF